MAEPLPTSKDELKLPGFEVFDFVNMINDKTSYPDEYWMKDHQPFIVNKVFSMFFDTVFAANEANIHHNMSKPMHFHFLYRYIDKRNRRGYQKPDKSREKDIAAIKELYGYSEARAREAYPLLKDRMDTVYKSIAKGGLRKS